jgi:hypothetical protein
MTPSNEFAGTSAFSGMVSHKGKHSTLDALPVFGTFTVIEFEYGQEHLNIPGRSF